MNDIINEEKINANDYFEKANNYFNGDNDYLQDYEESAPADSFGHPARSIRTV